MASQFPSYQLDLARFRKNCIEFLQEYRLLYTETELAYSVKTNYLSPVLEDVVAQGGLLEVVSGFEYGLASEAGASGEQIVFNGPYKEEMELHKALREGALVNVDSWEEFQLVCQLRDRDPGAAVYRVGVRCCIDHEGVPDWMKNTRFGVSSSGDELKKMVESLEGNPGILLEGLHCHYCPPKRSSEEYADQTNALIEVAKRLGVRIKYLNVGGGFFSQMPEAMRRCSGLEVPSVMEYASSIAGCMKDAFGSEPERPILVLEPGLAVVADCMTFTCNVVSIKRRVGRDVVVVDGSVYDIKPTKGAMQMPYEVLPSASQSSRRTGVKRAVVTGFTCMEDDVLVEEYSGDLAIGDRLRFGSVGAYTHVLRPPFIRPVYPYYLEEIVG